MSGTGTDKSYYEGVSENLSMTCGRQMEGLQEASVTDQKLSNNQNLSEGTKDTARALNAIDAGIQGFGMITGALDSGIESALLPMMAGLDLKGMASLPISKQLDPVLGIDVHFVTIPPAPAPIPMPHPYIGTLLNPKDFIAVAVASLIPAPPAPPEPEDPDNVTEEEQQAANDNQMLTIAHTVVTMAVGMLGASVKIGGSLPRAVAGTQTINIPHFPMGAGFHPAYLPVQKNDGHAFMGSLVALADNDPISGGGVHLHLNCNDVGIPSPHPVKPKGIPLYLPTGMIAPIPPPFPILTNPVPIPMNPVAAIGNKIKSSFGRLFKKMKKKASDKLHNMVNNKVKSKKLRNRLHKAICTVTGHPVDVADGTFFTDEEDFYLNGVIPISWERTYYSKSDYKGPLGYGWHHGYDMGIVVDENYLTFRMSDGRPIAFPLPRYGHSELNISEQMEAFQSEEGTYYIWDRKEDLYYYFTESSYDDVHLLSRIVNSNGFSIRFAYNSQGHLIEIVDTAYRKLRVINDEKGRITHIKTLDPHLETEVDLARYIYDTQGNLIEQINAEGDCMYFEYSNHLMTKEVWRNGLTWHFRYDGESTGARCIHTWGDYDIYNHKLTYLPGKTIVENSLGQCTEYHHKGGMVHTKIDAEGGEHRWLYNEYNQLLSETDPLGNSYLYSYDELGNLIQSVDPEGGNVTTEYPMKEFALNHLPDQMKDANGGVWKWKYDHQGNVVKRINPEGAETQLKYSDGLLQEVIDALGNRTYLSYDQHNNVSEVSDSRGNITRYQYDAWGRCLQITNAKGAVQKRRFDLLGRVIEVSDFDGNQIELTYDGIDNLVHYKDSQKEVRYEYKGMWKLKSRSDHRGTTIFGYDSEEQLRSITNEKMEIHRFILDKVGNVVKEIGFDLSEKEYQRDLAGRVTRETLAGGKRKYYQYDGVGRVTRIENESQDEFQSYEYYPSGQLAKAINPNSEINFHYNKLGLLVREEQGEHFIEHRYNAIGQRLGLQSSKGADFELEHDQWGYIKQFKAKQNQNQWESTHEYDSLGFEIKRLLPGKVQQSFDYDNIGRLVTQKTRQNHQQRHQRRYTWGINDQLRRTDDSRYGTTQYGYTPTGHLQHAVYGDNTEQWRKDDAVGNLYQSPDKTDREYSLGGRLERKGSWRYKYDEDGHLVEKYKGSGGFFSSKKEHWRYYWDSFGMLKEVHRPDGDKVSFSYDALGRRLSKKYKNTTTKWLWKGNTPLHEWKESRERKFKDGEDYLTTREHSHTMWVFEEGSFVPCAKIKNGKTYSIITDHLGTPTQMYNDEGESVWEQELDMYGKVRKFANKDYVHLPFRYQGQYYDSEIDLCYNRFRYYDPEVGRYISEDPIGFLSGEFNLYNYVDDPNGWLDIFGLKSKSHYSGERGVIKAEADLKKNGFDIIEREVTIKVNDKRIRADIVAQKDGKTYVFEVKNGRGRLTRNQDDSGVFKKGAANTNNGLGGGIISPSKGTQDTFDIATKNTEKIDKLGKAAIGTQNQSATFYLLHY